MQRTKDLIKMRLGISTTIRDEYLSALLKAVISEVQSVQGIQVDLENSAEQMFVVDYVCYRYQNVGDLGGMPKHLYWRMKNLYLKSGGNNDF